ncbi:hypothetical protein BZZ01_00870 [Nostocales cyanobacterium HT-58-2]|nr:hypothetical protein BZZ01_00870 [Nostocales cyanobacterium HT-58-2]
MALVHDFCGLYFFSSFQGGFSVRLHLRTRSSILLYLFLAMDVTFIILHIIYTYTGLISNASFSIEQDRGYAEIFQYFKEYWSVLLLGLLALRARSLLYLIWSLLFFYLLLDDSLQIHETLGMYISAKLNFSGLFNLRAQDFGELAVSISVSLFFLVCISIAYYFSDRFSKKTSRYLIKALCFLALFGIVVDMVHIMVKSPPLYSLLGLIEDGGENVVMSIIVCFIFSLSKGLPQKVTQKDRFAGYSTDS